MISIIKKKQFLIEKYFLFKNIDFYVISCFFYRVMWCGMVSFWLHIVLSKVISKLYIDYLILYICIKRNKMSLNIIDRHRLILEKLEEDGKHEGQRLATASLGN